MHTEHSQHWLTAAALFCRSLAWFPLWLLLTGMQRQSVPHILLCTVVLLVFAYPTALLTRVFRRRTKALPVIGVPLAAAASALLLYQITGSLLVSIVLAGVTVFAAAFGTKKEPEQLFSLSAYTAFLTFSVIVSLLLWIAELPIPQALTAAVIGIESGGYFLLRNQFMLLRMVNRRSDRPCDVPTEIRRGNLMLAGGILLFIAMLFLLHAPVEYLLTRMQQGTLWLAGIILRGINRLIGSLGGDAPDAPAESISEGNAAVMQSGVFSQLWLLVWIPVIAVLLWFVRAIAVDWYFTLQELISGWIAHRRQHTEHASGSAQGDMPEYTDTETSERPETAFGRKRQQRIWQKQVRAWRRLPDQNAKFYAGYQLLLRAPAWGSMPPRDADTVREIRDAWAIRHADQSADALHTVTEDFHADRYAEQGMPPQAITDMDTALRILERSGTPHHRKG